VLNSGTDHSENSKKKIMTEQAKWLDNDLESTDKKWKIVMVHMSMYPAKVERYDTCDELTEVIDKHGVDLVLSGHDHMVARTYPIFNYEVVETSNSASVIKGTGMINAILGCAGPKRYDEITEKPSYLAFLKATEKTQPTYSLFDVNDEKISVVTKQVDGTVVDSFEIVDR
jgi:3',5'-cyclic AMP phosphodiesterase CpdA